MGILSGDAADADDVMNAFGKLFKNYSQILYNSDYIGFDSKLNTDGTLNSENQDYDTFKTDTMTESNMSYAAGLDVYVGPTGIADGSLTTLDEFNDSSVDATLWTIDTVVGGSGGSASVTEDASDIILSVASRDDGIGTSTAKATLDGSGSKLLSDYNNYVRITTTSVTGTFSTNSAAQIVVTDGSNTQVIYNQTTTDTDHSFDIIRVGNILFYNKDGGAYTSVDISGWTVADITFYVRASAAYDAGQKNLTFKVNWAKHYAFGTPPTASVISDTVTSGSTITNAITTANYRGTDSPTLYLSADNGANYESTTDADIHRFSNTGTQLKFKAEWTGYSEPFCISEYSTIYNWY